ncbi:MAG: hypothetical protein LC768_08250 [Acidobacteria bacterium]|nr:hypothetical protein [Acidobacteriota bacterium]
MKIFLFVFLFAGLFSASVAAQSRDAKIKNEVVAVLTEQTAAWNAGSIDDFFISERFV